MGNMSYCRFENTSKDLDDCVEALENHWDLGNLSSYEITGLRNLQIYAKRIVEMEDEINEVITRNAKDQKESHQII